MEKIIFETPRLLVRPPVPGDEADIFRNYAQDPEVTRYLVWKPHTGIGQTAAFVNQCVESWNGNSASMPFAIFHKEDQEVIGMLEFRVAGFKADFGYVLARRYWNRGLMTEALRPALDHVWGMRGVYKIWAVHDIDNPVSGKVLVKLGLERVCVLRNWMVHPNVSDRPRDCVLYSMDR